MAQYEWVTLYKEFPKTTAIYAIKIRNYNRPSTDLCCFMSELAGYDATSKAWDGGKTAATGYYTFHRMNIQQGDPDFHDSWNHSSSSSIWNSLPIVDSNWKYHEYPSPVYWAGEYIPANWNADVYALVQVMIEIPFYPSKSSFTFESTGGTKSFEIYSPTSWNSTSSSWVTINPSSGTGDATVNITVGEYSGTEDRRETITFTNNESKTFDIKIRQRKPSTGGYSGFYKGDFNITDMYLGETPIEYIYLGENIIFQKGEFVGIRVSPKNLTFEKSGGVKNIWIRSDRAWSLSWNASWITGVYPSSGGAGRTQVSITVDENTEEEDRTDNLVATTTDLQYSSTCAVKSKWVNAFENYMFNYNAKEFISGTKTIPKKAGQLFDVDIVLGANPTIYSDYLHFPGGEYVAFSYMFPNAASNPFNRTDANCEFTFIWKSSTNNNQRMIANRSGRVSTYYDYNWWLNPENHMQNFNDYSSITRTSPAISSFVVNSQNIGLQKDYTNNLTAGPKSVEWNNQNTLPDGIAFFRGYANRTGESWTGDFYWMYCAMRTLTDNEIQQVIDYNENL